MHFEKMGHIAQFLGNLLAYFYRKVVFFNTPMTFPFDKDS